MARGKTTPPGACVGDPEISVCNLRHTECPTVPRYTRSDRGLNLGRWALAWLAIQLSPES